MTCIVTKDVVVQGRIDINPNAGLDSVGFWPFITTIHLH